MFVIIFLIIHAISTNDNNSPSPTSAPTDDKSEIMLWLIVGVGLVVGFTILCLTAPWKCWKNCFRKHACLRNKCCMCYCGIDEKDLEYDRENAAAI